ncbi:uncharacterized protein RCC_04359 [Ramularia collo-cygni]|uniref:F-box domain-containing protein n=1 Tax=Ramularia collo-cygni TaxID=112498 RepID=A0A2D3V7I3_9PEZI|nr:uncharacterized protein RCC_04359 [Ramularia collo-cygni]CZT18514.1 uncharacterized protein RCC_04359 [Ramularia collo-cygni]
MASLLDLPIELLILILEKVGGRELRRGGGSARLAVCRVWYTAALPIYTSGFATSHVNLYGHNIDTLRSQFGYAGFRPIRHLMHKNTREVRIHLLGHPWDEATAQADEICEYTTWNSPPYNRNEDPSTIVKALDAWRDVQLKPCLDELFSDLRRFEALESVIVEARSEPRHETVRIPHRDYMYVGTISKLLLNLPVVHNLVSLTLDTHGTELLGDDHICHMVADVLPRIRDVRLRMTRLCPDILGLRNVKAKDVKLKCLIIKLHSPQSMSDHAHESLNDTHGSFMCSGKATQTQLLDGLIRESRTLITKLDHLASGEEHSSKTKIRISHAPMILPRVQVIDCRSMTQYLLKDIWFAREDDGKPRWFEKEDGEMLVYGGPYTYDSLS